jgi:hypothetical protein
MKVRFTRPAQADLDRIHAYVSRDKSAGSFASYRAID